MTKLFETLEPEAEAAQNKTILRLMTEGYSLRKAAISVGLTASGFLYRTSQCPELAEQYAKARDSMLEKMADDTLDIADQDPAMTAEGKLDGVSVAHARLRVDTRKWLLSKLAPKKYGDKLELSGDAANPIAVQRIERVIVKPKP